MAKLLIEIWIDLDTDSMECSQVCANADERRHREFQHPVKVHEFWAVSILDAGQKYYDYQGFGKYSLGGLPNHYFTDEEEQQQRQYLATRTD